VIETHTPLLGRGNVANLLAAVAVAQHFGVPLDEIASRAGRLRPSAHRGEVLRLPQGVTVVDDSYNSSPTALQRALEVVARESRAARKAAVLGEMLELGEHTLELHRVCGEAAAAVGLDRLVAVGGDAAQALADAAVRAGMPEDAVTRTASSSAASDVIVPWLASGDLVLVKGSRGIGTDAVVKRIVEEFS
jgi:UDP-N-acetylmuramoyl-tripeptide--D-alanyl-D-alanine ligase